jgi:16S rRNA (uracil1498-N3)-methyltransferase
MALPRFLVPSLNPARGDVALPADEARHLTRVLRLGPGARVAVFDGTGREFVARIATATRDRVVVTLEAAVEHQPEPRVPITLAQAILKGDKMDAVVRDATMLGVSGIVPLMSEHVSVKLAAIRQGRPEVRWGRIAVASVKQCRRPTIPPVCPPVALEDWLAGQSTAGELRLFLVEPGISDPKVRHLRSLIGAPMPPSASVVVGPEGGWSANEIEAAARSGCVPITLGPLTLRADAVALVALSALSVVWGD